MTRRLVIVVIAASGLAIGGCGTPAHHGGLRGKFLKVINNTAGAVTMNSCPASAGHARDCSAAARTAPGKAGDFPLSPAGSLIRLVVISGYGGQPVCFPIPPTSPHVRTSATVSVTDAQTGNCIGPDGSSATGP
jgi:hypothetical protein